MQQRIAGADGAERGIRVPQPIGQRVHPGAVVALAHLIARGEVGDVTEFQPITEAAVLRLGHLSGQRDFQFAEVAAEFELLLVGQRLVAETPGRRSGPCRLDRRRPASRVSGCEMSMPDTSPTKTGCTGRMLMLIVGRSCLMRWRL